MRELLTRKMTTAIEVAALVKAIPIEQAADLIEQYARSVAAQARIDATVEANERFDRLMRKSAETAGARHA